MIKISPIFVINWIPTESGTVKVLKFCLPSCWQNGQVVDKICKQCRSRSDCSWRSSLIRVYTVCYSTILRNNCVKKQNLGKKVWNKLFEILGHLPWRLMGGNHSIQKTAVYINIRLNILITHIRQSIIWLKFFVRFVLFNSYLNNLNQEGIMQMERYMEKPTWSHITNNLWTTKQPSM